MLRNGNLTAVLSVSWFMSITWLVEQYLRMTQNQPIHFLKRKITSDEKEQPLNLKPSITLFLTSAGLIAVIINIDLLRKHPPECLHLTTSAKFGTTLTMAENKLHPVSFARRKLEECRNKILKDRPSLSAAGDSVYRILSPSDRKNWQIICSCNKVSLDAQWPISKKPFRWLHSPHVDFCGLWKIILS